MTKSELRKSYKNLRQQLTSAQIEDYSLAIANRLLTVTIWDKAFYHIFLPIEEQKEINTEFILNILSGKDKHIVVSKSSFKDYSLKHYLLTDNTRLKKNSYGIPEPVDGIPINTTQIEVVFVPLLAFDSKGNRVGYGQGFYDRFLSQCAPDIIKIGLSFFEPTSEVIPFSEKDIPLDYCITPSQIYQFPT